MKKSLIFAVPLLVCLMTPFYLLAVSTCLNEYNVPVGINVPYYQEGSSIPKCIDIVLQPGDLYKSKTGKNGYIYEQYGLMPGLAEELVKNNSTNVVVSWGLDRKKENEEYNKFIDGLTSTNMPDWWITECQKNYAKEKEGAEKGIKENLDKIYWDKELCKKRYNQAICLYSFLTNIQNRIDDLSEPNSDPDKDGLDNRTEFYCGSNPWKESGVISYPNYLQIIPDGSQMVTSCFYIANHSKSNLFCKFDNALIYIQDKRYRPYLYDERGKAVDNGMDVPGQSTNKVYCLIKDEYFPRCFYDGYNIEISITNNLIGTIILYTPGDYSHPLPKPTNISPKAGYCIEPGEKVLCSWRDEWNEDMQTYQTSNDYKLQVLGLKNKFPDILEITRKKSITFIDKDDWEYHRPEPGNYIWRVNKQTHFSNPVSSEWSWFNIGKEVAPQKSTSYGDYAHMEGHSQAMFVFTYAGKPYDLSIGTYKAANSSRFLDDLRHDQEIYYETNSCCFYIKGVFNKPGVYTNTWRNITSDGQTNDTLHYFIVRNPSAEKSVRSFYYLKDKTIVHELFVNVPFDFKERKFFEEFSKTDSLLWDSELTMEFGAALPEGLQIKRTEDGADLKISGVPVKAGTYKIPLVFSKGKYKAEEIHVFKVKDIDEPFFDPEKKLRTTYKKVSTDFVSSNRGVFHSTYVGMPMLYPFFRELSEKDHNYVYYISNCSVKIVKDLPTGIMLTNFPLSAVESLNKPLPDTISSNSIIKIIHDKYYSDRDKAWLGLAGTPTEAGISTNYVIFTEPDIVFTNIHFFIIKQDLK